MWKVLNHEFSRSSRLRVMPSVVLLTGLVSMSFPAAAQVYPVNGVFSAIDPKYPADRNEACMALKTFGVEAVSNEAIPELIIFSKDKRYDVKRDVQTEEKIKSIKEEWRFSHHRVARQHSSVAWVQKKDDVLPEDP
jgi:hypothetical protein